MIFIFEDNENSDIHSLLMKAYKIECCSRYKIDKNGKLIMYNEYVCLNGNKLVYCYGVGNIKSVIEHIYKRMIAQENNEQIIVLMDCIPGNRNVISIYRTLYKLKEDCVDIDLVVMPIICSEYYIIKSLKLLNLVSEENVMEVNRCLNKEFFKHSSIIVTDNDKKFCKNFEKYCKLILKKLFKECMIPSSKDNLDKGLYYKNSCNYSCKQYCDCRSISMLEKVMKLLIAYKILPSTDFVDNKSMNNSEMIVLHDEFVKEFNYWCDVYIRDDNEYSYVEKVKIYKKLPY